jgi:hypothetical protein
LFSITKVQIFESNLQLDLVAQVRYGVVLNHKGTNLSFESMQLHDKVYINIIHYIRTLQYIDGKSNKSELAVICRQKSDQIICVVENFAIHLQHNFESNSQ